MKRFLCAIVCLGIVALFGCSNEIREIPAGYVGKILTPTGWETGIREAGQINLGQVNSDGTYSTLVLLEVTSIAIKENFGTAGSNKDAEDHRIIVNKVPLTVDVYTRCMIPSEEKKRDAIFAQVTPVGTSTNRVSLITIKMIYEQFAMMDIRSGTREVFSKYQNFDQINNSLDSINIQLGRMALTTFTQNGVPLTMQNMKVSNVKPDISVWDAENKNAAALAQVEAINKIGAAIRDNPGYITFKKYETYAEIAKNHPSTNFNIFDGANSTGVVVSNK